MTKMKKKVDIVKNDPKNVVHMPRTYPFTDFLLISFHFTYQYIGFTLNTSLKKGEFMKRVYDKDGRIAPSLKDLGLTNEEFEAKLNESPEKVDSWYKAKVDLWHIQYAARNARFMAYKIEKEKLAESVHWYNSMSEKDVYRLIYRCIENKESIFEKFLIGLNFKSPLYKYYLDLIERITEDNYLKTKVLYSKLKKFPGYNPRNNCLEGSPDSFVTMFIKVFPPIKRLNKKTMSMM